ncbi:hypothetical protein HY572_06965 [Candidatus Micrarchaeota archaeon]|nr:hypothetical protein [Candidatus Micrarchaeota archaeon]
MDFQERPAARPASHQGRLSDGARRLSRLDGLNRDARARVSATLEMDGFYDLGDLLDNLRRTWPRDPPRLHHSRFQSIYHWFPNVVKGDSVRAWTFKGKLASLDDYELTLAYRHPRRSPQARGFDPHNDVAQVVVALKRTNAYDGSESEWRMATHHLPVHYQSDLAAGPTPVNAWHAFLDFVSRFSDRSALVLHPDGHPLDELARNQIVQALLGHALRLPEMKKRG